MPTLTAIDILGVQRYIFASNRLRDAVASSYQVYWATLPEGGLALPEEAILLAAGGTAILQFAGRDEAKDFAATYSRRLFDQVPGLEVVLVHLDYEAGTLATALLRLQDEILRAKSRRRPDVPLLGLGVTAACRGTGLPAVGFDPKDPEPAPLSAGLAKALKRLPAANQRWQEFLEASGQGAAKDRYSFPLQLDHLGRSEGESSFLGVVHIDGNGFGRKIGSWLQARAEEGISDQELRRRYGRWSADIARLGQDALRAVVARCRARVEAGSGSGERRISGSVPDLAFTLKAEDGGGGGWFLPLRPLILGGDDLTFVCDGRLALDLGTTALEVFENSPQGELGALHACAGIALVHTHFPFARAYEWSEALCASAKSLLQAGGREGSALDWHIGAPLPNQSLEQLRRRQYWAEGRSLTSRPYHLGADGSDEASWRWLAGRLLDGPDGFRSRRWSPHRNKVKGLASLVREGPEAIEGTLQAWRVAAPQLRFPKGLEDGGFQAASTPLLDAVELLDLHLPLEAPAEEEQAPQEVTS